MDFIFGQGKPILRIKEHQSINSRNFLGWPGAVAREEAFGPRAHRHPEFLRGPRGDIKAPPQTTRIFTKEMDSVVSTCPFS